MNNRKVATCLLAVCAVFPAAPALSATDPSESHRLLPAPGGSLDDNDLAERLRPTQDMTALRSLAEKMLKDPDKFSKLTDQRKNLLQKFLKDRDTQQLLKDPKMQELFRDALKNPNLSDKQLEDLRKPFDQLPPEDRKKLVEEAKKNPDDFNLKPKDIEELKKLAELTKQPQSAEDLKKLTDLWNKMAPNPNVTPEDVDALKRLLPSEVTPPTSVDPDTPDPPTNPNAEPKSVGEEPKPEEKATTPPTPDASDDNAELLLKLADWLQEVDPDNQYLAALAEWLENGGSGDGDNQWLKDAVGQGADWFDALRAGGWLPSDETKQTAGSWFDKVHAPALPKMGGGSSGSSSSSSASSRGLSSGSNSLDMEQLARFFVWTAVLAVVGFAGWRVLLWYRAADAERRKGLPRRWPVLPGAVATRGDLVRAFEYLALLVLGLDAQHRHHLDLARRLGTSSSESGDERRQAANHLAHLYELARYAPEDEPLPEAEMAVARRDLSFLAGAGAA